MAKDWRDFKAQNGGIAGAREKFENACEVLVKKQYPNKYVSQMEVSRGDGGIDIFIGKYGIEPIIVVQCKFFLEDFGSSQKQQIKKSFDKAYNNKDYELIQWVLCIPRVFTQKDYEWWFDWIEEQDMKIELINGNELISSMKEHNVYNQIFQMEDSLKIDEIHKALIPKKIEFPYEKDLEEEYSSSEDLKRVIFSYYSAFGINFNNFRNAKNFIELFEVLKKEQECLYCLLKELGKNYNFMSKYESIDCEKLKEEAESKKEINGVVLRVDTKNTQQYTISGYLRFTSNGFEPLSIYENKTYDMIPMLIEEILKDRSHTKFIEVQLILSNDSYLKFSQMFHFEGKKIHILKRLSSRIDNYDKLNLNSIRFWQRNSQFYLDYKEKVFQNDFLYILDEENYIDEFKEPETKNDIFLLSNSCLNKNIQDIYDGGIPFVFYSSSKESNIDKLDFNNQKVKDMKDVIFKFMRRNKSTHFIYDDYNDLEFLKIEEAEDDDYL